MTTLKTTMTAPDPVFTAIEQMKAAMAENVCRAKEEKIGGDKDALLSQGQLNQAGHRWMALFRALLATVPTTHEGLEAMMRFITNDFFSEFLGGDDRSLDPVELVCLLNTVETFALKMQCTR